MTAAVPLVERLAEVLAAHREDATYPDSCICEDAIPDSGTGHFARHVARALLPVVEQAVTEARGEALREAAKEAEERGDIGKDGGCEAWTWLRIRADRIGGAE